MNEEKARERGAGGALGRVARSQRNDFRRATNPPSQRPWTPVDGPGKPTLPEKPTAQENAPAVSAVDTTEAMTLI